MSGASPAGTTGPTRGTGEPAAIVDQAGRMPLEEDEGPLPFEDDADADAFAFLDEEGDTDDTLHAAEGGPATPAAVAPASFAGPVAPGSRRSLSRAARMEAGAPAPAPVAAAASAEASAPPRESGSDAALAAVLSAAKTVAANGDAAVFARLFEDLADATGSDLGARARLVGALAPLALSSPAVRRLWLKQLRSLDKLAADDAGKARAAAPALVPVLDGGALWALTAAERREAARLLVALNPYAPVAKALAEEHRDLLALFPLLYGETAELDRTLRFAGKHRRVGRIAALAATLVQAGTLDVGDLLSVDARLGDGRFLKSVAASVVSTGAFDVAMRLLVDADAPAASPAALRALVDQFHAAGELPLVERALARAAAGESTDWAAVAAAAARHLGLPTLALAGTVAQAEYRRAARDRGQASGDDALARREGRAARQSLLYRQRHQ